LARLAYHSSCALTLAYTVWILLFPFTPEAESAVSSLLVIFFLLITIALGFSILRLPGFPAVLRQTWKLVTLAAIAQLIAEGLWFYDQIILGIDPFPSSADFFYIFYYVFLFAAVLSMPFAPLRRQERTLMAMDILIVVLVSILFLYYFVLSPLRPGPQAHWTLDLVVASIYPCTDVLILVALFSFLQRDVERVSREVILLLSASLLLTLLADVGWMVFGSYLSFYPEAWLDWLWTVSTLAMLMAAYWQFSHPAKQTSEKTSQFRPLLRDMVLYLFTGATFILMLVSAIDIKVSDLRYYAVIVVCTALGILVMLRQYIILAENRRLYHEMERLATSDPLTGLNNRRSFDRTIEIEARRAERFKHPYTILMMDMDNFKLYNDRFGHLGGDMILKRMAKLLLTNLRVTDFLARFGGDEFVAILPETEFENAQKVAVKIMDEAKHHFLQEAIGLSVGVATWEPGMPPLEVLEAADRDLYRFKQQRQP